MKISISPYRIDFFREQLNEFTRRIQVDTLGTKIWLVCPEELIIMKTIFGRVKDRNDIRKILKKQGSNIENDYITTQLERLGLIHIYQKILENIKEE